MYDIKPGQLVEVEWIDPSASVDWIGTEKVTEFPKITCYSVGWVHLTDDGGLILTACYGIEKDVGENDTDLLLRQYLPWGCVTQIWILE